MSLAAQFTRALESEGIPILGVSIGVPSDRLTWVIHFQPSATMEQRERAEVLRLSFDPTLDPDFARAGAISAFDQQKLVKALGIWTAQKLNIPLAQARAEILAIFTTL